MDNIPQDPMQGMPMQANSAPVKDGSPYFLGDQALIKFSSGEDGMSPSTYWLVDKNDHTIRPFESQEALDSAFGSDVQDALQHVMNVIPPSVDESGNITDGVLAGFDILGPEYAIKSDGSSKPMHFSPHQLRGRYGKPVDDQLEGLAAEAVDGFLNILKTKESVTGIKPSFINKLRGDNQLMAFYISAMAYGDYTLNDIYAEIERKSKQDSAK